MIKPSKNFNQLIALFSDLKCNRIPGQLVIQLTDRCNAFCPQCGMRVTKKFKRSTLSADNVKRIIDAAAQKGVNVVRLACISFGCCYGKPVTDLSPFFQKLMKRFCFVYYGATKKISYADGLDGKRIVPVPAFTALICCLTGLVDRPVFK